MEALYLKAPAKVNYRLDVLRRRPDGYHDLRMIMQRIDLCDEIVIVPTDSPGIRVTCDQHGVPDGPGNIAWRSQVTLIPGESVRTMTISSHRSIRCMIMRRSW